MIVLRRQNRSVPDGAHFIAAWSTKQKRVIADWPNQAAITDDDLARLRAQDDVSSSLAQFKKRLADLPYHLPTGADGGRVKGAVQAELDRRGWTREKLAVMAAAAEICSRATVHNWLTGTSSIAVDTAERIAQLLDLSVIGK